MHNAAMEFIFTSFHNWKGDRTDLNVLEIGSLDINGSVRPMFKPFQGNYVGIDMQEGPGVDIVADAAKFINFEAYDVVVCAEVFEHTPDWKQIIYNCYNFLFHIRHSILYYFFYNRITLIIYCCYRITMFIFTNFLKYNMM